MVVLVIGILLAIAIPTYLGVKRAASDRATQSNVRNALTTMRIYYNANEAYTGDPTLMNDLDPSLEWTEVDLTGTSPPSSIRLEVFPVPAVDQTVVLGGRTSQGRCFFIKDTMGSSEGGVYFDFRAPGSGSCAPPSPTDAGWTDKW